MSAPSLFMAFARVGLFGFGGGPSMLPLMQQECVNNGFLTGEQFMEGLAVGNSLPGPIATKMALYVGYTDSGVLGALAAVLGVLAPSLVLMAGLTGIILKNRDNPAVAGALRGVRPVIIGMLFFVAVDLAPAGITGFAGVLLALAAFAALFFRVHPGLLVVLAAVIGAVWFRPN